MNLRFIFTVIFIYTKELFFLKFFILFIFTLTFFPLTIFFPAICERDMYSFEHIVYRCKGHMWPSHSVKVILVRNLL